jgi:hypothetical protein
MSKVIWKAEITDDMVAHLSEEKKRELFNDLSDAVNDIGSEAEVGREFKHDSK